MLKAVHFQKSKSTHVKIGAKARSGFIWVDALNPNKEDMNKLNKEYKIFKSDMEDALDEHERSRVHIKENYTLIIYKIPYSSKETARTTSVGIFWTGNTIITMHRRKIKNISNMMEYAGGELDGPVRFVYLLLDLFTTDYFRALEDLGDRLSKFEEKVLRQPSITHTKEILKLKKVLIYFQKGTIANRDVLHSIREDRVFVTNKKEKLEFNDLYNDNLQLIDLVGIDSEVLASIMEVDMSSAANSMSDAMKKLTVIASFVLIPTLIASIYGMNFRPTVSMWNMPELNWVYGYPFALGLMVASILAVYYYSKKMKWL